jgi:hypothetical protein
MPRLRLKGKLAMKNGSSIREMDGEVISSLGGAYLAKLAKLGEDINGHGQRMSWAIEHILGDKANEFVDLNHTGNAPAIQLIGAGVDFTLEAADIIRTEPAPVAIKELDKLVTRWKAEIQTWIDAAKPEAASG